MRKFTAVSGCPIVSAEVCASLADTKRLSDVSKKRYSTVVLYHRPDQQ